MKAFLAQTGWDKTPRVKLTGDASARQYWRLSGDRGAAILMYDPDGDIPAFVKIARHLTNGGLSAPRIMAQSDEHLLIEDLGDGLFATLCAADPELERPLYLAAADALIALHALPPPNLTIATPVRLAQMIDLVFECYVAGATGRAEPEAKASTIRVIQRLLTDTASTTDVVILRDYHAENLIWLPDRTGPARVGLLDFQDAMIGHRAYDLVSLLRDARRDVSQATTKAVIAHFCTGTDTDPVTFGAAFAALGVQRNLRILGIFARLAATRGKPHYIDLIPRVWAHIETDLAHPALAPLRPSLEILPDPTPDILERLKSTCPTPQ